MKIEYHVSILPLRGKLPLTQIYTSVVVEVEEDYACDIDSVMLPALTEQFNEMFPRGAVIVANKRNDSPGPLRHYDLDRIE